MANEIQKVKRDIALNQAVILVGSNVSFYTTNSEQEVSHWKGLLKYGLRQCHQSGWLSSEELEYFNNKFDNKIADRNDYLAAVNQIKFCFENKSDNYEVWLIETMRQLSAKKTELIRAIGDLGCPILTTNYDSFLEDILGKKPLIWNKLYTDEIWENLNDCILHLHGYFEESNSVICSNNEKLRSVIEGKTLLFIGYDAGILDPNFSNLMSWISGNTDVQTSSCYKLVSSSNTSFLENIKEIQYGHTSDDLVSFIKNLRSFAAIIRENLSFPNKKGNIRKKYLHYLLNEYGHVSIFGYANSNINLPLQSVYVELKFDPTHPSIKAMKTLEINEEFKRKLISPGFLSETQRKQLKRAIIERNTYNSDTIYRDFMVEQWLTVLLSNRNIFTETAATAIRTKVNRLKQSVMEKNSFKDAKQYQIQQAYNEFKHFVILGHPGAGKTTLSKWLVMNMAKQCLGEENMLFDGPSLTQEKIPILIPIWKYVDQLKQRQTEQKKTLLQFIYENPTFNSSFFQAEERSELSALIIESLLQGNVLVIFEGLDEVPAHVDRSDLMKEINTLLERGIDYDDKSNKLIYSIYEQKEINNIKDPTIGNRFIITSRIEGNYFEEINFFLPRLTIENMSDEALKLFCRSYMECIRVISLQSERSVKHYKADQLYDDINQNKDIFQLAINPQLASVIAAIYNQYEGQLPEKRIDLYEKAIEKMIERLVTLTNYVDTEFGLNAIILWSILQEIAEYLHSKVEGLSEKVLKEIIKRCLIDYQQQSSAVDELTLKLVNIFKYQAGLLSEFGHNSFRFIHRTFQEYLAAKNIIYFNGIERTEEMIYEKIISKIGIPNWRVPLSMTFGILSKLPQHNGLFNNVIERLLIPSDTQFSTPLVPFVIIDSLNDMCFSSGNIEHLLIRNLANMLLVDYQNISGFARLKEHQELIHSYFYKLKEKYDQIMAEWFIEKFNHAENLAACANVIYQLKWYTPKFHEIFLKNLHHDSITWNWPIDSLVRFYSKEVKYNAVSRRLKFKTTLKKDPKMIQHILQNQDWLCVIAVLYGGYQNYNTPTVISEYYELVQFLSLSDNQRMPFILYYQEVWGRDDPAYSMAVRADEIDTAKHWNDVPIFDMNEIYKESFLTNKILRLLHTEKPATELREELRMEINSGKLSTSEKTEVSLALIALGDFDLINSIINQEQETFVRSFGNRIEQLICILSDPIARYSSQIADYLLTTYNHMKTNQLQYNIKFSDYCKIYLSLLAKSGGLPVDTQKLAEAMDNVEDQCNLYAEYYAFKLTGATDNMFYKIAEISEAFDTSGKSDRILQPFLKINDTCQIYRPVRAYPWPTDGFTFQSNDKDDIPISFFNCLENINSNINFLIDAVSNVFIKEEYFNRNPDLIPSMILLYFGNNSTDLDRFQIYKKLLPELEDQPNIKEFLFDKIQSISHPYYKSRALYQLAEFHDEKSDELLNESFLLTKKIPEPILKFQVLEKIFSIVHYKNTVQRLFIQQIVDELIITFDRIDDLYDRVIASVRLSFYGSGEFQKKYLTNALELLSQMQKDDQKIQVIIKLKPLVCLYDDLHSKLKEIIGSLTNPTQNHFVNACHGKILYADRLLVPGYTELQALFLLFAQLNDMKSVTSRTKSVDQLWIALSKDIDNQSHLQQILEIALKTELFLTPQVAIILDEIVRKGEQNSVSILFPYIIKPSNEVLPIVQRWFTDYNNQNPIKNLAALLLVEAKHIFASAIDTIIDLLRSDHDQMRYRAQRIFQHPERDVDKPSKRISVIGEKALTKILYNRIKKEHSPRVRIYLNTFFFDLLWDDPQIFQNLYQNMTQSSEKNSANERTMFSFDRIKFINHNTWNSVINSLQSSQHPSYMEELLQSTMHLIKESRITEENWIEFIGILSLADTSQFTEKFYFSCPYLDIVDFIIDEVCGLTNTNDETYFEIFELRVKRETTIKIEDLLRSTYERIKHISACNFYICTNLNQTILDMLSHISVNVVMMENLIQWLIQKLRSFKGFGDTIYALMTCDCLLSLVSACAQKEDYLYRKITKSPNFNKYQMIKLLEKVLNHHPYFMSRGSAFILLAAMDQSDHRVIINAMNILLDENTVKEYSIIGIPLIHLSPNEFLDDLLESLKNESAIKAYEILKIFTQFGLNEKIDANGKSKIIHYLANEIGQLKSKKPVSYYYTEIQIPFTTTLENELYKAWIKIQGLSGKTQYSILEKNEGTMK